MILELFSQLFFTTKERKLLQGTLGFLSLNSPQMR